MRPGFRQLGLGSDATLADVKRAYARLLKQTRPDEDPVGFQRLQEAYEICVKQLRQQAAHAQERERVREAARVPATVGDGDDEGNEAGEDDAPPEDTLGGALPETAAPRPQVPRRLRIEPDASEPHQPLPRIRPLHISGADDEVRADNEAQARRQRPVIRTSEILALLEKMVAVAEQGDANGLRRWLESQEALLSLDAQRLVAQQLPAFLLQRKPLIGADCLGIILGFFIGDDYSALRADPRLRQIWDSVQAEEVFRLELAALRRTQTRWLDRLALDEVLETPKPWRRRLLLAVPTMSERIVAIIERLRRSNARRADATLQAEAVAFWSALGAPNRLTWRMVALAHAQLIGFLLVGWGAFSFVAELGWREWLTLATSIGVPLSVIWFALKGLKIAKFHWNARNERRRQAGIPPRDAFITACWGFAIVGMLMGLYQAFQQDPSEVGVGAIGVLLNLLPAFMIVVAGRGRRWEMMFLMAFGTMASWRMLGLGIGGYLNLTALNALSTALGLSMGILADEWHARSKRIQPSFARHEFNWLALKLAGVAAFMFFITLYGQVTYPEGSDGAQSQAERARNQQVQERIKEAAAKMSRPPWRQWVEDNKITERPEFGSVDEAFTKLLQASGEPGNTRLRAFHFIEGPLAGDWLFSGGNESGPDFMAVYLPADAAGVRKPGQILCRQQGRECQRFRKEAAQPPPFVLEDLEHQRVGGHLSDDSPLPPPPTETPDLAKLRALAAQLPAGAALPEPEPEPAKFDTAHDAYRAVLAIVQPYDSRSDMRDFYIGSGAVAGKWVFEGGDWNGPDRFAHFPLVGKQPLQALCDAPAKGCSEFKQRMRTAPEYFHEFGGEGGRATFASPGLAPVSAECPPVDIGPHPAGVDSLKAKIRFDNTGMVQLANFERPAQTERYNQTIWKTLRHCLIQPAELEGRKVGGTTEVRIPLK